jgi:hypothetical protein
VARMPPKRQFLTGRVLAQFAVLAVMLIIILNYQGILDDYALATFHPSDQVASIESRLGLTPQARAIFYRAHSQIDDKASFNRDCDTQPHELELGCYYQGHIYVLRIDNQSLAPEMDAVTAHELLHAEWNRMSAGDRATIGAELERIYATLADKELQQRMADYAQSEPGEEQNELHSILGTEFANLSPVLEQHYSALFSNRATIVTAHSAYLQVFTTRRSELETELAKIRGEKAQLATLNREMEAYRSSNRIEAYNNLVPTQNRLVDDINSQIASYQEAVDEYNALSTSLDSQTITDTEAPAQSQ